METPPSVQHFLKIHNTQQESLPCLQEEGAVLKGDRGGTAESEAAPRTSDLGAQHADVLEVQPLQTQILDINIETRVMPPGALHENDSGSDNCMLIPTVQPDAMASRPQHDVGEACGSIESINVLVHDDADRDSVHTEFQVLSSTRFCVCAHVTFLSLCVSDPRLW
jgi:hypothetical protein